MERGTGFVRPGVGLQHGLNHLFRCSCPERQCSWIVDRRRHVKECTLDADVNGDNDHRDVMQQGHGRARQTQGEWANAVGGWRWCWFGVPFVPVVLGMTSWTCVYYN